MVDAVHCVIGPIPSSFNADDVKRLVPYDKSTMKQHPVVEGKLPPRQNLIKSETNIRTETKVYRSILSTLFPRKTLEDIPQYITYESKRPRNTSTTLPN